MADRLAPVGEGEVGIHFLGVLEGLGGLLVPEAVEGGDPPLERGLGRLRTGVREMDGAEVGFLGERRRNGEGEERERCEDAAPDGGFAEHGNLPGRECAAEPGILQAGAPPREFRARRP